MTETDIAKANGLLEEILAITVKLDRDVQSLDRKIARLDSKFPELEGMDFRNPGEPPAYGDHQPASGPAAILRGLEATRKRVDGAISDINLMEAKLSTALSGDWLTDDWLQPLREHQKDRRKP